MLLGGNVIRGKIPLWFKVLLAISYYWAELLLGTIGVQHDLIFGGKFSQTCDLFPAGAGKMYCLGSSLTL